MSDIQESRGADYLSELIKSVMASTPPESPPLKDAGTSQSRGNDPPDIISSLLSNPELLSKLPTLMSSVKPIIEILGKGQSPKASASPNTDEKKEPPISDRRSALLCAMKPYLSHDRQVAIDYIIKLSRLGDILKTL